VTGQQLRAQIQNMANDDSLDYGDANYLEALNFAINFVSTTRIKAKDAEFVFDLGITNGQAVPDNFQGFVGSYPLVYIKDTGAGRQFFHTMTGTPVVKFYVSRPNLTLIGQDVPFKTTLLEAVKLAALIYLKEQRAYDMTAEKERMVAMVS
jgi:hypothetical protein